MLKTDIKQATEKLHRVDFQHDQLGIKINNAQTAMTTIKTVLVPGYDRLNFDGFASDENKASAENSPLFQSLTHIGALLCDD